MDKTYEVTYRRVEILKDRFVIDIYEGKIDIRSDAERKSFIICLSVLDIILWTDSWSKKIFGGVILDHKISCDWSKKSFEGVLVEHKISCDY